MRTRDSLVDSSSTNIFAITLGLTHWALIYIQVRREKSSKMREKFPAWTGCHRSKQHPSSQNKLAGFGMRFTLFKILCLPHEFAFLRRLLMLGSVFRSKRLVLQNHPGSHKIFDCPKSQ